MFTVLSFKFREPWSALQLRWVLITCPVSSPDDTSIKLSAQAFSLNLSVASFVYTLIEFYSVDLLKPFPCSIASKFSHTRELYHHEIATRHKSINHPELSKTYISNTSNMLRTLRPISKTSTLKQPFFTQKQRPKMDASLSSLASYLQSLQSPNRGIRTSSNAVAILTRQMRSKKALIWTCIGINSAVFIFWQAARSQASSQERRQKVAKLGYDMQRNFILSAQNIKEGRWWTTVTSAFSHMSLGHIAMNMFTFHQVSQILVHIPGLKAFAHFTPLILGSAFAGSLAFLSHTASKDTATQRRYGLGFSGAVSGVITAAAMLSPQTKMLFFGVIPVPLWAIGVGYVLYDTYAMEGKDTTVAHDAHVGGAVFGASYYILALRKFGGILGRRRF